MPDPLKVDSHVHIYRNQPEAVREKTGYEVWEYGSLPGVHVSDAVGLIDDFVEAMEKAGVAKAVTVNLFSAEAAREIAIAGFPEGLTEDERARRLAEVDADIREDLKAFNLWACETARSHPGITAFVAADVNALPGEECAAHIADLVSSHGAGGVKLHGAFQRFDMGDERLWPVYETCRELRLPIIGHAGPDQKGLGYAEPRAFTRVLKSFPEVRIVLAHLGGAAWQQAAEVAEMHPNAFFDCCEIIEWLGAPRAPTETQLVELMRTIGVDRIMMGSDYPWYDLDHTVERVMELPLLSEEEKYQILGANAVRILGL